MFQPRSGVPHWTSPGWECCLWLHCGAFATGCGRGQVTWCKFKAIFPGIKGDTNRSYQWKCQMLIPMLGSRQGQRCPQRKRIYTFPTPAAHLKKDGACVPLGFAVPWLHVHGIFSCSWAGFHPAPWAAIQWEGGGLSISLESRAWGWKLPCKGTGKFLGTTWYHAGKLY